MTSRDITNTLATALTTTSEFVFDLGVEEFDFSQSATADPDWLTHPVRVGADGRVWRYDLDWPFYVGVHLINPDGSEVGGYLTPICRADLISSVRASGDVACRNNNWLEAQKSEKSNKGSKRK